PGPYTLFPGLLVVGVDGAAVRVGAAFEHGAEQAVDDEGRVGAGGGGAEGAGEVGIAGRREGEVAFVLFRVTRLLKRAQHEVAENALFRVAADAADEALVHLRGDGDAFRHHLVLARLAASGLPARAGALGAAAVGLHGEAFDR